MITPKLPLADAANRLHHGTANATTEVPSNERTRISMSEPRLAATNVDRRLIISTDATATAKQKTARALGYARVATHRPADSFFDDQEVRLKEHYASRAIELVKVYSDYGVWGVDDNRPGLQAMIAHALRPDSGITQIGVCGLDRLCRSDFQLDVYRRKLASASVSIVAIT